MSTSPVPPPGPTVLADVRAAADAVARRARDVRIDDDAVERAADSLATDLAVEGAHRADDDAEPGPDPWRLPIRAAGATAADDEHRAAVVLALATINFGSGWHPVVRKRPGCSGATTMALGFRAFADDGGGRPLSAERLAALTAADAHRIFGQPADGGTAELMAHFAAALGELGRLVADDHDGSFLAFVDAAGGTAAGLVQRVHALTHFRDVSRYDELVVPLYKRAQLAAADLDRAFAGAPPARFTDLDELTAFADNLVPHVLRLDGVLAYTAELAGHIDAGRPLEAGSREEVEIRAVGVAAVERLRAALARRGIEVRSSDLDARLWRRGGAPRYKAVPRHRARSVFY